MYSQLLFTRYNSGTPERLRTARLASNGRARWPVRREYSRHLTSTTHHGGPRTVTLDARVAMISSRRHPLCAASHGCRQSEEVLSHVIVARPSEDEVSLFSAVRRPPHCLLFLRARAMQSCTYLSTFRKVVRSSESRSISTSCGLDWSMARLHVSSTMPTIP